MSNFILVITENRASKLFTILEGVYVKNLTILFLLTLVGCTFNQNSTDKVETLPIATADDLGRYTIKELEAPWSDLGHSLPISSALVE